MTQQKQHLNFLEQESLYISIESNLIALLSSIREQMLIKMYVCIESELKHFDEVYNAIRENREEYQRAKTSFKAEKSNQREDRRRFIRPDQQIELIYDSSCRDGPETGCSN